MIDSHTENYVSNSGTEVWYEIPLVGLILN